MMSINDFAAAIKNGDSATIQRLVDSGYNLNVRVSCQSTPVLLYAVESAQLEIVKILLRGGADIDKADTYGFTPCQAAARLPLSKQQEFFEVLLSYQPNLGLKTTNGHRVLQHVLPTSPIATMLVKAGAPLEDIDLLAFSISNIDNIQALLDRGVVVSQLTGCFGTTPLHKAAATTRSCNTTALDMLVNVCGIDIDVRDMGGCSCIFTAAECGNWPVLFWAVCVGGDVNCRNVHGSSPLYKACLWMLQNNYVSSSILYTLLGGGADLDAAENHGETPRQLLLRTDDFVFDEKKVEKARRLIAKRRLVYVYGRSLEVCMGLQSLQIPALQMCEILLFSCGPVAPLIPFHQWWKIATTAKHFSRLSPSTKSNAQ